MLDPKKSLSVLSIENPERNSDELYREFLKMNYQIIYQKVSEIGELEDHLKRSHWDLVLVDNHLPTLPPFEALRKVRDQSNSLPLILRADDMGMESVADMLKAGVEDIVLKSRPERIQEVVKRIFLEQAAKVLELQSQKSAQKALAAKEQMLAIVSHDIKNPLSAIQLEAQMLLRAVERSPKSLLSEEVKIQSNRILKTTDRLKILISDLLDKNKSENSLRNLNKEYVDAGKLLQEVVDSVRPHLQDRDILLKLSLPAKGSWAYIDRNKMFQVFSNLLNNAIKFTPPKGMIHLLLEEVEQELIFSVVDSGPGLGETELPCIFEKYWSGTNAYCPGTGLGLFICKTVIEAHGGYITVENVPEGGAKFYFSIPKDQQSVIDVSLDKRKKIYILDDDEDLREVMSWALGKAGYSIHSFRGPTEALDCLMKGSNLPHLMVVDYHMEEMKGCEFLLKKDDIQEARSCPVLITSTSPTMIENNIPREFNGRVVPKPIDLEALVSNVKELLLQ